MNITFLMIVLTACMLYYATVRIFCFGYYIHNRIFSKERNYSNQPSVSVMMSCFNEGEAVYDTIKSLVESNYPSEKLQIVAFDDCSKDNSWYWLQKAAKDFPGIIIRQNSENKGKPLTMIEASKLCTGEILLSTDSDCIFDANAIRELVSGFDDPKVGGVGGFVGISNANESLLSQVQSIIYFISFYLFKPIENATKTVQCLAGPIFAIRSQLYRSFLPDIESRLFLGKRIAYGEDRFLTQLLLRNGYKTYVNLNAKCWVGTPVKWLNYLNQQLRWRRGAIQTWLMCWFNLFHRLKTAGVISTICCLIPLSINFLMFLYIGYLLIVGSFLSSMVSLILLSAITFMLMGGIIDIIVSKKDPKQKLCNPFLSCFVYAIWFPISCILITPWALCTLDDGGWVTRQNGMKGNI